MATKKSATSAKKPVKKAASTTKKATVAKVTTVKSVAASATATNRFSFTRSPLLAASVAEFIGAFMLAGVVLATQGASIYVMFTLVALTLAIGMISGAHFNPALTVGAWATKRIKSARAISYIVAQVLGALLALIVLDAFVKAGGQAGDAQGLALGQQTTELFRASALPGGKEWLILAAELIGALLFAFGFSAATREKSRIASAWVVGGSLFVALTVSSFMTLAVTTAAAQSTGATPLSTVLNPAVAGALQAVSFSSIWPVLVYAVAPIVGATLGFVLRDLLTVENEEV
jgi:aquaporin Z